MILLSSALYFPPIELTDEDGLLAIGGDLCIERLQLAYSLGIFPWYNEGEPICWYCPNPRFVLYPNQLHISKSLQKVIDSHQFEFRYNTSFSDVVHHCKEVKRMDQYGTWITSEMEQAYLNLHEVDKAICAEAWLDNKLVGGLYGVLLGKVFCGESMFSLVSNASKFAFVQLVHQLQEDGIELIDCQIHSNYLESFGAVFITMDVYKTYLTTD